MFDGGKRQEFNRLPAGFETELGVGGALLSTGQKQRLSIARAVVRDSRVLILDEPTASLDADTGRRVFANLKAWATGRVVIVITHRLSTIRDADRIAYLAGGRIAESGAHDALMARHGSRVAYVFQEHQLLTDTVAANLRIAKPDATLADMETACALAGALDFVRAMPEGFESPIGRGGGTLSTGRKQRLSIARGLLRDAPVLILDEPTSSVFAGMDGTNAIATGRSQSHRAAESLI